MSALSYTPTDLDILVRTLYGECRGEPLEGQQGVAWVIRNRVQWSGGPYWWGDTPALVCQKHAQYSCWLPTDPNYAKILGLPVGSPEYAALRDVALSVLSGAVGDPTGHASHYERIGTGASWAAGKTPSATIGNHAFYEVGPHG